MHYPLICLFSPKQVAKKLNITEDAAKRTMSDFFRRFSTLKRVGYVDHVSSSILKLTNCLTCNVDTFILAVDGSDKGVCAEEQIRESLIV